MGILSHVPKNVAEFGSGTQEPRKLPRRNGNISAMESGWGPTLTDFTLIYVHWNDLCRGTPLVFVIRNFRYCVICLNFSKSYYHEWILNSFGRKPILQIKLANIILKGVVVEVNSKSVYFSFSSKMLQVYRFTYAPFNSKKKEKGTKAQIGSLIFCFFTNPFCCIIICIVYCAQNVPINIRM